MENPSTWKRAELVIMDAQDAWHDMNDLGVCGPSLGRYIADALRAEGLLNDQDEPEIGWEGLRCHHTS